MREASRLRRARKMCTAFAGVLSRSHRRNGQLSFRKEFDHRVREMRNAIAKVGLSKASRSRWGGRDCERVKLVNVNLCFANARL